MLERCCMMYVACCMLQRMLYVWMPPHVCQPSTYVGTRACTLIAHSDCGKNLQPDSAAYPQHPRTHTRAHACRHRRVDGGTLWAHCSTLMRSGSRPDLDPRTSDDCPCNQTSSQSVGGPVPFDPAPPGYHAPGGASLTITAVCCANGPRRATPQRRAACAGGRVGRTVGACAAQRIGAEMSRARFRLAKIAQGPSGRPLRSM